MTMNKGKGVRTLPGLALAALLLPFAETLLAEGAQMPPARVVTAPVRQAQVAQTSMVTGVLAFERVANVASEVEGLVVEHRIVAGNTVKKGDVLVRLGTEFLEKDIDISYAQLGEVDADIERLQREMKRFQSLEKQRAASRSAYEQVLYEHKAKLRQRDGLIKRVERLQLRIAKSTVHAPFDGLILEKNKELGEWVKIGDGLARIASTEQINARLPVSESLMRFQTPGTSMDLELPSLGKTVDGRLLAVEPVADVRSKTVFLKVRIPYTDGVFENLTARAQVPVDQARVMTLVPRAALVGGKQPQVYVVRDGKAVATPVEIEARTGTDLAIRTDSLAVGTPVVVDGNDRLRPGQAVQVVDDDKDKT